MRGRTKSFFEDTSILLILIVVVVAIYQIYINFFDQDQTKTPVQTTPVVKETKPQTTIEPIKQTTQELTEKVKEKKEDIKATESKEVENIEKAAANELVEEVKAEPAKVIEKKPKKVDLAELRRFLIETKMNIIKNVVISEDNNLTNNYLRIRVTILKDGNYEQLKLIEGDKELFEQNKENILKVFPLNINEKIVDEFPRYFRLKIQK